MNFDGVCVSDYSGISNAHDVQKIGESMADTGLMSMDAGMDVEMPACAGFCDELKHRFADGRADMHILDQAVLRVLEAKFRMGLFEHPYALEGEELHRIFTHPDEREVTLQSAREALWFF